MIHVGPGGPGGPARFFVGGPGFRGGNGWWLLPNYLIALALLVIAATFVVMVVLMVVKGRGFGRMRMRPGPPWPGPRFGDVDPERLLAIRFARGEIGADEFHTRMNDLRQTRPSPEQT